MSLTAEQVGKLVEKSKAIERDQTKLKAQIEAKTEQIDGLELALKDQYGIDSSELDDAISEAETKLTALATEFGLIDAPEPEKEAGLGGLLDGI